MTEEDKFSQALREIAAKERRGRPAKQSFSLEFVREATPEDVELVNSAPANLAPVPFVKKISHRHHELARLLANGASPVEAAAQTGYTTARIQQLRNDPSFDELFAHYCEIRDAQFVDAQKQLATLGHTAANVLLDKLEEDGTEIPYASAIEIMKSAFDRSVAPSKAGGGIRNADGANSAPAVQLNVSFVAPTQERVLPIIDLKPTEIEDE